MSLPSKLMQMEHGNSLFEQLMRKETPPICSVFQADGDAMPVTFEKSAYQLALDPQIQSHFEKSIQSHQNAVLVAGSRLNSVSGKRIAVLFSGGPAAGGHNVLLGIQKALGKQNTLLGVQQGPKGLLKGDFFEIDAHKLQEKMNLGGFDFLGSDRTKIKTREKLEQVRASVQQARLDGLIIIGGDDSNTNAAVLAEYLIDTGCAVIGVPKTIDGDLQAGELLPISFGFDTATKIYAELVGNILQDTPSSMKYWHFIKLMGRSASLVTLEVALQTHPHVTLISEEVREKQLSLNAIIDHIAEAVMFRAEKGKFYGVILVPEGLIEAIPEFNQLIEEMNEIVGAHQAQFSEMSMPEKEDLFHRQLSQTSQSLLASLPAFIKEQLLLDRDSHGNLNVSQVPIERLLIEMTAKRVQKVKFGSNHHFFGYEGRCGAPSRFDAMFTYNLGLTAGSLALSQLTGYMASITKFNEGGQVVAIPLTGLIHLERRTGQDEMVIQKALVDLDSPAYHYFTSRREEWMKQDLFSSPGPRQLWGPLGNQLPILVALNQGYSELC